MAEPRSVSEAPPGLQCDFCGEPAATVRRIALDGAYERLRKPHRERYACPACSAAKERERDAAGATDG